MPFLPKNHPYDWIVKCNDPRHNPPGLISLPGGTHKWQCPKCKTITEVVVPIKTLTEWK